MATTIGFYQYSNPISTQSILVDTNLQAATPVIVSDPDQIVHHIPTTLSITCATPGAVIYYTVDGSPPTLSSAVYSSLISINATVLVRAFAVATGYGQSDEASKQFLVYTFIPYQWSSPTSTQTMLVAEPDLFAPYVWTSPTLAQDIEISIQIGLEFTNVIPSVQNIRSVGAIIRAYNVNDNSTNTDPGDEYYFSLVPEGSPDSWTLSPTNTFQVNDPDPAVPAGQMARNYTLKAKIVRGAIEIGPISRTLVIDEVAPVTIADKAPGSYPPAPLTILLNVDDYTATTTYYTVDGTNPGVAGATPTGTTEIYDENVGIIVTNINVPTEVRFFSVDAAGNTESPNWLNGDNTIEITLDSVPPVVTVDSISDTVLTAGEVSEILWHVDEFCKTARVEIGGGGVSGNGVLLTTFSDIPANVPQNLQIAFSSLPNGNSTIYIYAVDGGDNAGSTSFEMQLDNQIPVVTVYEVCRHTLSANDSGVIVWKSSVAGDYVVRRGGANSSEGTLIASGSVDVDKILETSVLSGHLAPDVSNEVRIYVTSPGGNIGFASENMSIDTTPPTTTPNILGATGPFLSPFSLRIDATDAQVSGVITDAVFEPRAAQIPRTAPSISSPFFNNYPQFSTDVAMGGYEYSAPTATQDINIINYATSLLPYQYSLSTNTQSLNIFAPIGLSIPQIANLGTTNVRIQWTTSRVADSTVEYGTDQFLNTFITFHDSSNVTNHEAAIGSLAAGQLYYYRIRSSDGTISEQSAIYNFQTNAIADTIPPTITNLGAIVVSESEIDVVWNTDEVASSVVIYADNESFVGEIELPVQDLSPRVSNHTYRVSGLTASTQYWFKAKSLDAASNQSISAGFVTATTFSAGSPIAQNIIVHPYRTTCIVRWETDVPTTGKVSYGSNTAYGLVATDLSPALKTSHEIILTGLTPDRVYHFVVGGKDQANRDVLASDQSFNTRANRDSRIALYVTIDGSVPTTSHYNYRVVGNPFTRYIDTDITVKYFALDGFGNQQAVQTQVYTFDTDGPVITVDSMYPILLAATDTSTVRFKVSEPARYRIQNQIGTVLASNEADPDFLAAEAWVNVVVSATDMVEDYNHISIIATDEHGNQTSVLVGHIIKDTTPPIIKPTVEPGFFNSIFYVNLVPTNLRPDENVSIYYTTDGKLPTFNSDVAHGQVYNILVANTTTIRWFGVDEAGNVEPSKYATYVIDRQAPIIYANPVPNSYDEVIEVELRASEPGTIFYTDDETIPTDPPNGHTRIYSAPIKIQQDTVLTCFAKDLAGNVSDIKTFAYEIKVLHDKKFKKVIGFQDKMFLETEFNEAQDNINRRIEEMAHEVIGEIGLVYGFDIIPSEFPGSFEFYMDKGKAYINGKFVEIMRKDQSFVPSPLEDPGVKTYHVVIVSNEPIFRPSRPGQPGWEEGVPDITTYRLEEGYVIRVVEEYPDEPYAELYDIIRPENASSIANCTIIDKRKFFEPLARFQRNMNDTVSDLQANLLALGLEVESYKLRNLLGLKNAFVDTFESTKDIDLSRSRGYRYVNTRFEL